MTDDKSADYAKRLKFDTESSILDINLIDVSLETPKQADEFYDTLEQAIGETGREWFVLTNYERCTIGPGAAAQFGFRRNLFNAAYSLGSLRYSASSTLERALLGHSKDARFDGYICRTREEAVAQIAELRRT